MLKDQDDPTLGRKHSPLGERLLRSVQNRSCYPCGAGGAAEFGPIMCLGCQRPEPAGWRFRGDDFFEDGC